LGGLFGIIVAGFFASSNDVFDMQALKDMNLDSIMDVLPAGLIKDAQALQVGLFRALVLAQSHFSRSFGWLAVMRPRICSLHTGVM
jgi:hypothetical protein